MVECLKCADERDQGQVKGYRRKQGHGNAGELLPGCGAINIRCLVGLLGNITQTCQEDDRVIANKGPDTVDDDRDQRQAWPCQEAAEVQTEQLGHRTRFKAPAQGVHAKPADQGVGERCLPGGEDQLENDCRSHRRGYIRQKVDHPEKFLANNVLIQNKSQDHPQNDLGWHSAKRVINRNDERLKVGSVTRVPHPPPTRQEDYAGDDQQHCSQNLGDHRAFT